MHATVLVTHLGPYGAARALAATRLGGGRGGRTTVLELATWSTTYRGWSRPDASALELHTLFPGADADALPAAAVAGATWRALGRLAPSVVFLNGWSDAFSLAALAWCRARGRPAVVMTETHRADRDRGPARELAKRLLVSQLSGALAGGRRHVDYLVELGMPRALCFTPYDVVDNAHFATGAARARTRTAAPLAPYVLSVGRFVEKKNLALLVRAYATYARATPAPWPLVLAGSGPLEPALRAEAVRLGVGSLVRFPGWASYEELPALYAGAGVFVLPSLREQWGLVVNEAMAAGVPVLVSSVAGSSELVHPGTDGFVFEPRDEAALAALLSRIAAGSVDGDAMGRAAATGIATHSPERFAEAFWSAADAAVRRKR